MASEASAQHAAEIGCGIYDDRVGTSQIDPAHSDCCVIRMDVTGWVDTNCLATGDVIENGGATTEDTSWLQPVHEDRHINMAELDAVL